MEGGVFLIGKLADPAHQLTKLTLVGIADEAGVLEEGEIFCQYQQDEESDSVVVQSEVLVCRAPACELVTSLLLV